MEWTLDTHTLIWALFEPSKLGARARAILSDPTNDVSVNPISYWEISLKCALGKLTLPRTDPSEIPAVARQIGLAHATLDPETLATFHRLPIAPDHRDPFDRLIVWHCIRHGHTLLTRDRSLACYHAHGLRTDW